MHFVGFILLLPVPDFQAVSNSVVFTEWVYGLGKFFEPSEEAPIYCLIKFGVFIQCFDAVLK